MKIPLPDRLDRFVGCTIAGGLVVLAVLVALGAPAMGRDVQVSHLLLAAALFPSEMLPIVLSRRGKDTDLITMSTTYAFALTLIAPVLFVVLVQCTAVAFDGLRRGSSRRKTVWNCSQYVLTLSVARAAYVLVDRRSFLFDGRPLTHGDLVAVLVAAIVYFLVNNGMTAAVVALADGQRILPALVEDAGFRLSIFGVLLGLAPVVVESVRLSAWLLPVVFFAVSAVRRSAALSLERERQSLHDALTGLPNRVLLDIECGKALQWAAQEDDCVALMIIDLDHFRDVNDTLGHHVGDALLLEVAERLRALVGTNDLVARLGGDEFGVLRRSPGQPDVLLREVERWLAELEQPYSVDGVRITVGASIGVAAAPADADDAQGLFQRADVALYGAKERRSSVVAYTVERDEHSVARLNLLAELRDGIERGELEVHYQPQCDCHTGALTGVEALVRWRHPSRGLLLPEEFILAAETTSLITALTTTVLDLALRQLAIWRLQGLDLTVAINVSARQMTDLDLPEAVQELLARHRIASSRLILEVTESSMMAHPTRTVAALSKLSELGVGLSIDDFGTGYSSLAYLNTLGPDELKIDRSFVIGMSPESSDAVIVRSIIELGHNLGLRVVAEGVETLAAWEVLRQLDCDIVQGYLLGRPMPGDRVLDWAVDNFVLPPRERILKGA